MRHIAEGVTAFSTTRKGGVSQGNYSEFNINDYCGDCAEHVAENRRKLADELGISKKKLRTYNELPKDYQFMGGEIVYLEKKHRRATKEYIVYVVRQGDSMYSISQKFGIRLKNLYKLNKMEPDSPAPKVGDILRLR